MSLPLAPFSKILILLTSIGMTGLSDLDELSENFQRGGGVGGSFPIQKVMLQILLNSSLCVNCVVFKAVSFDNKSKLTSSYIGTSFLSAPVPN